MFASRFFSLSFIRAQVVYPYVVYSYTDSCRTQRHNEDEGHSSLRIIYLSLYLKGLKGLLNVLLWEGVGDRTELQYIDPHTYGYQRCVFLVLQGCSTGGPGGQLSAGCWLSLRHLVTKLSELQTNWLPVFTELYNSSIAHSISLEWHVWSSLSGNNCHAVHMSLSSGASVYDCTMGFYLAPCCQPSPPTRFLPITAIGMCPFRRLWNGMIDRVEGQYTTHTVILAQPQLDRTGIIISKQKLIIDWRITNVSYAVIEMK